MGTVLYKWIGQVSTVETVSTTLLSSVSLGCHLPATCAHYDCWFHSQAADDYFLIFLSNIHTGLKAPAKNTTGLQFSSLLLSSNFRCWKSWRNCLVLYKWMIVFRTSLLSLVKITFITWHLPVWCVEKSKNHCFVKYGCWFGIKTDSFLDLAWSKCTIFFFLPFFYFPFTVY